MNILNRTLKTVLLVCITMVFLSCKGQAKKKNTTVNEINLIGKVVTELDPEIWKIFQDKNSNYWFGSNGNGVYVYDGNNLKQYTKNDGLVDNTIRGIQEDHLGAIFIETANGISKYDGSKFVTLKPITSAANKWKLLPNDLWFGYNAKDIYRYDGEFLYELQLPREDLDTAFTTKVNGLAFRELNYNPYSVYGLNRDSKGNLWFGTFLAGAFRYDGNSFLWFAEKELSVLPDGKAPGVRSILEDKNGYFWLSNFISKYKIDNQSGTSSYEKLNGIKPLNVAFENQLRYFNSGLSDDNGDLWMTTYGSKVWKYDGETLSNFTIKNGETEVLLITIYKDNQGTLWLGTQNAGVYKFNGNTFEKFKL